jgi:hypothetical protein
MTNKNNFACSFYGCDTQSQTSREEHRLRILRGILRPETNETRGDGKISMIRSFVYSSPNIIGMVKSRRLKWVRFFPRGL